MLADTETVPRRGQLSRKEWGPIYMKWMPQSREWLGDQDRRVSAGGRHLTGWIPELGQGDLELSPGHSPRSGSQKLAKLRGD